MNAIIPVSPDDRQITVGAAADDAARSLVFEEYHRDSKLNTQLRQRDDLAMFAEYLEVMQFYPPTVGTPAQQREARKQRGMTLYSDASAWSGVTYGLVSGFVRWQLQRGFAFGTVNVRLSTVKKYVKLAFLMKMVSDEQNAAINAVKGKKFTAQKDIDEARVKAGEATRKGTKKAAAVSLDEAQVKMLKKQPITPQGRRDALIMAILLDLGLRVGELAILTVDNFNLSKNTVTFYRPKVNKTQTLALNSKDLQSSVHAWFNSGDAPLSGKLLRGSLKSKDGDKLGAPGMNERSITARVEYLGQRIGVEGLSAHDLRHSWATRFAYKYKNNIFALQESGGWGSLAMPRRYVENAKIANEGYSLDEDEVNTPHSMKQLDSLTLVEGGTSWQFISPIKEASVSIC